MLLERYGDSRFGVRAAAGEVLLVVSLRDGRTWGMWFLFGLPVGLAAVGSA